MVLESGWWPDSVLLWNAASVKQMGGRPLAVHQTSPGSARGPILASVQTTQMTQTEATALAIALVHANCPNAADGHVRMLHQTADGAETLRLIVRDNLAGAGEIIANALWANL